MPKIISSSGSKLGEIDPDGNVFDGSHKIIGQVLGGGEVKNASGSTLGKYYDTGDIYSGSNCVGKVADDDSVYYYDTYVGRVTGSEAKAGGAALILLLRK